MNARVIALTLFVAGCSASSLNSVDEIAPESASSQPNQPCGGNIELWESAVLATASEAIHIATAYYTRKGYPLERPLIAHLRDGVWYVEEPPPPGTVLGGGSYLELCQSNGAVLAFYSGQ